MFPAVKNRFWKEVTVEPCETGHAILLDGRNIRTPAKTTVVLPTKALAEEVAAEWRNVEQEIDPADMPMTRRANAALDRVSRQRQEVAEMLASYAETDLICYRATHPAELIRRQAEAWDPLLEWVQDTFEIRLVATSGVIHVSQDTASRQRLGEVVSEMGVFPLTGFHDLVTLTGSLVIALAAIRQYRPLDEMWQLSRVDEAWQEQLWGVDEEAVVQEKHKRADFLDGFRFYRLSQMK